MSVATKLYNHLPVPLQNAFVSAYGLMWYYRRFGGKFNQYLDEFSGRESYSAGQWKSYQQEQLQRLLQHAFDTVPYYKRSFKNAGIGKAELKALAVEELHKLPILEKEDVRKFGKDQLVSSVREKGGSFYASSGSTGTPTNILYSYGMHQRISALYEARCRRWSGVSFKDPRGMIGGRRIIPDAKTTPPFYRYNAVEKQVYFSAYHINQNTAANYVYALQKHKPLYLVGYAMSIYLLATFIRSAGLRPPSLKAVLTSSEKLTNDIRSLISEVFQCKVYDAWSGMEWCGLISENEYGQLLLSPDSAIVEIIKPDGSYAQPGETGELICTGFLNYDQPLIRYRIGDTVTLAKDQRTKCGRNFPVIEEIIGRTEDVVETADGRAMVRFHGIFVGLENVMKGQIVQEDYDRFTIKVMTTSLLLKERKIIEERMISQVGNASITIVEVDDIPVGPNGKFKAVISKLKNKAVPA